MALPLYYNWRNLFVRKLSTTLTFVVVATVVFVLSALLSFAEGIRASLTAGGSPCNVMVLAPGATAESTSIIFPDQAARLVQAPGIARDASGQLMISHEVCVQTTIPRRDAARLPANVAVRGVDDMAFAVHDEVRRISGEPLQQGALQALVGKAAQERFGNTALGDKIQLGRLGNRLFEVVGVFEARGGALESEIWVPRTILSDVYLRPEISSAIIRVTDAEAAKDAIAYVNGPAVKLDAKTETNYYEELSSKTREIVVLATVLISIMSIGAIFAVANTMYAAVDGRRREIAMLRTIGFERGAIITSFIIESLLVCVTACLCGLAASLLINGSRKDFLSDATWTVLAYELKVTPMIFVAALSVSTVVGLIGALAPAWRASRMQIIQALRKA